MRRNESRRYDSPPGRDRYRDRDDYYRDRDREYALRRHSPPSRPRESGFQFRGAASNGHGPQHSFTFQSSGPSAPRFSPEPDGRHERPRRLQNGRGRGGRPQGFQRRNKAAHDRQILRSEARERTPEQLEGMNLEEQPRFANIDLAFEQSREETSLKRKLDQEDDSKPKWSNPDPYTALPPPGTSGMKVDILSVIRNAKAGLHGTQNESAVKANDDFISFSSDPEPVPANKLRPGKTEPPALASFVAPPSAEARPASPQRSKLKHMQSMPSFQAVNATTPVDRYYTESSSEESILNHRHQEHDIYDSQAFPVYNIKSAADTYSHSFDKRTRRLVVVDDWQPDSDEFATPWHDEASIAVRSPMPGEVPTRFHSEIDALSKSLDGTDEQRAVRLHLIDRVEDVVAKWNRLRSERLEVHAFGSFAADLYLPGSDMDLVILSRTFIHSGRPSVCQSPNEVHDFARHIRQSDLPKAGSVLALTHTKVPLVKYTDKLTGLNVDISFENPSGLEVIKTVTTWIDQHPAAKPLILLVKQLMLMYGLSEVRDGGLGGFSIVCLVITFLEQSPEVKYRADGDILHYGELLINFLELFGSRFNVSESAIQMTPPGFFAKDMANPLFKKPERLAIIDPHNEHNDVSGGTTKIGDVLDVFYLAFTQLKLRLEGLHRGKDIQGSILGAVYAGDYGQYQEIQNRIRQVYVRQRLAQKKDLRIQSLPDMTVMLDYHRQRSLQNWRDQLNGVRPMKRKRMYDQFEGRGRGGKRARPSWR